MRFEVDGAAVTLPHEHPLAVSGTYSPVALVELAAQLAGRSLGGTGARGVLVEVDDCELGSASTGGERLVATVELIRAHGAFRRFRVALVGPDGSPRVSTSLTLKVEP